MRLQDLKIGVRLCSGLAVMFVMMVIMLALIASALRAVHDHINFVEQASLPSERLADTIAPQTPNALHLSSSAPPPHQPRRVRSVRAPMTGMMALHAPRAADALAAATGQRAASAARSPASIQVPDALSWLGKARP